MLAAWGLAALLVIVAGAAAPAGAQTYPNKPIRLVMPFPPGGGADIVGRIIGQKLSERLGQPVVPDNRPGAGGNTGIDHVAKSKPDGYTLLLGSATLSISPSLYKNLTYDAVRDLAPIMLAGKTHIVVLARPNLPVNSLKELVEYAKANPGKLNFGTGGVGTITHLASELLNSLAKIKMTHVSYKGTNQAMVALMSGEIDIVLIVVPNAVPQVKAGKVKALAVLSDQRIPELPTVPTAREVGIDNYDVYAWYGLLAPAGTPREAIDRVSAEWVKIAAMPETREKMRSAMVEPMSSTPEQFSAFLKGEIARWGSVVKEANVRID
jgi:tripartite-type tricarboxylate transporter receptor subunit TctC